MGNFIIHHSDVVIKEGHYDRRRGMLRQWWRLTSFQLFSLPLRVHTRTYTDIDTYNDLQCMPTHTERRTVCHHALST